MVPPQYLSVIGNQVMPPSTVLKTPPPTVPIQYSFGRATLPATADERPPRYGPISRQRSAFSASVSMGAAIMGKVLGTTRGGAGMRSTGVPRLAATCARETTG